jgi:MFS family permease
MIKKIFPIIPLTFVNVIGFTLLVPILPSVISRYAPAHLVGVIFGILITSYTLSQFIGTPILGSLSDHYGRKPLLLISQIGTVVSWVIFGISYFFDGALLFGFAVPLIMIAVSRIIDGITGGNMSVAHAWISDVTEPHERTKAFGIVNATYGMGSLFGPVIGGLSASTAIGYVGTGITAFIISFITLALTYFTLSESLPGSKKNKKVTIHFWNELNIVEKFKQVSSSSFIKNLLTIRLFFSIVFASYTFLIILYVENSFNFSSVMIGVTLSIIGVFSIFNQIVLVHNISKKIGDLYAMYSSLVAVFIGMILLVIIPNHIQIWSYDIGYAIFLAVAYILSLGVSLALPTFKSLLTNSVDKTKLGAITGFEESLNALGKAVTPILAGSLFTLVGSRTFLVFAFLLLVPHLYIYIKERRIIIKSPGN